MRLIILAGLIVGVTLAFQSAHARQSRIYVVPRPEVRSVQASAPSYIAMNAWHRAQNVRPDVDFDLVIERS